MRVQELDLSNPVLVFAGVWIVSLAFMSARLIPLLTPLRDLTVLMVLANVLTFTAIYVVLASRFPRPVATVAATASPCAWDRARPFLGGILAVWAAGSVLEIILAHGVPTLWKLEGITSKGYGDFGVSSFHGLMNALYLFGVTMLYAGYCLSNKRTLLLFVGLLLLWPIILISRGLLIWAAFQVCGVHILFRRFTARAGLRLAVAGLVLMVVFGVVGNFRMGPGRSLFQGSAAMQRLNAISSGFLWVYTYVTASINNVNAAIDSHTPSYVPYFSVQALLPTVIRNPLYGVHGVTHSDQYPLHLVSPSFTTTTIYGPAFSDFGILGAVEVVTVAQFLIVFIYLRARRGALWAIIAYATCFQILLLSTVVDTLTSLVNVMQFALAVALRRFMATTASDGKTHVLRALTPSH